MARRWSIVRPPVSKSSRATSQDPEGREPWGRYGAAGRAWVRLAALDRYRAELWRGGGPRIQRPAAPAPAPDGRPNGRVEARAPSDWLFFRKAPTLEAGDCRTRRRAGTMTAPQSSTSRTMSSSVTPAPLFAGRPWPGGTASPQMARCRGRQRTGNRPAGTTRDHQPATSCACWVYNTPYVVFLGFPARRGARRGAGLGRGEVRLLSVRAPKTYPARGAS